MATLFVNCQKEPVDLFFVSFCHVQRLHHSPCLIAAESAEHYSFLNIVHCFIFLFSGMSPYVYPTDTAKVHKLTKIPLASCSKPNLYHTFIEK